MIEPSPTGPARSRSAPTRLRRADFVDELRDAERAPACGAEHQRPALGHRRAHHPPSRLRRQPAHPQAHRGGFGWIKTVAGRARPLAAWPRSDWEFTFAAAAYNLVRLPKLIGAADDEARAGFARAFTAAGASPRWTTGTRSTCRAAHITFSGKDGGELAFIAVEADLDVRYGSRDGSACAEFSWEGFDDGSPASGRGWAPWAPPAASSGTSTSTTATIQASFPNATDFFNSLLVSTHNVFRPDYEAGWFSAPFFDIEDAHHAKTDLWVIGNVALTLMHFFNEINEGRNVIKFVDNFWPLIQALGQKNKALRGEMMSTDRYKQAMAKEAARKQPATG